jgi:hypothetical protein
MRCPHFAAVIAAVLCVPIPAWATKPKLDTDTCTSLRLEQIKFRQSGILNDMSKGAAWAKANLSADRMREIEHYLELDEQVQFGCRDAKLSAEAKRASEAAARIELNSDADSTAPVSKDPPKPGAAAQSNAKDVPKKETKKKSAKSKPAKKDKESNAADPSPPVIVQSQSDAQSATSQTGPSASFAGGSDSQARSLPAFGAGAAEVLPWSAP